jgi:hypothetical protein
MAVAVNMNLELAEPGGSANEFLVNIIIIIYIFGWLIKYRSEIMNQSNNRIRSYSLILN